MRFHRILESRCIKSWLREASRKPCCDWLETECVQDWLREDMEGTDDMQNTHQQVKTKILERMEEWTEMFSKDPDLGIMEQAYMRLKTQSRIANSGGRTNSNNLQTQTYTHHRNHKRHSSQIKTGSEKSRSYKWH